MQAHAQRALPGRTKISLARQDAFYVRLQNTLQQLEQTIFHFVWLARLTLHLQVARRCNRNAFVIAGILGQMVGPALDAWQASTSLLTGP